MLERCRPAPGLRIHGDAAPFKLRAGPAVEDDDSPVAKPAFQVRIIHRSLGLTLKAQLYLLVKLLRASWNGSMAKGGGTERVIPGRTRSLARNVHRWR